MNELRITNHELRITPRLFASLSINATSRHSEFLPLMEANAFQSNHSSIRNPPKLVRVTEVGSRNEGAWLCHWQSQAPLRRSEVGAGAEVGTVASPGEAITREANGGEWRRSEAPPRGHRAADERDGADNQRKAVFPSFRLPLSPSNLSHGRKLNNS